MAKPCLSQPFKLKQKSHMEQKGTEKDRGGKYLCYLWKLILNQNFLTIIPKAAMLSAPRTIFEMGTIGKNWDTVQM